MSLTAAQQQAIIAKESAWIDSDEFAPLDLSAFPALQPPPAHEKHDDRRSPDWRDTPLKTSARALRAFVTDPPIDVLDRVGEETGNSEFRADVRDQKGELIAQQFRRECSRYMSTDRNFEIMLETLSYNALSAADQQRDADIQLAKLIDGGYWTVANLKATYEALNAEGLLDVEAGSTRNLSSSECLRVARMAQAGNADAALGEYLRCALDDEQVTLDIVNDPTYRPVCDEARWQVFQDITYDYVPTPEREAYIQRHCAGRPITLALLQSAWAACQKHEASYARQEVLNQVPYEAEPPTERELNELSDDQVDRLYHQSLREYVRSIRAPGLLV